MPIAEGGTNLSSGERQLIALTRLLILNPSFFVLDEATAHLDSSYEKKVLAAMEIAFHERTGIVIAHRLSTIQSCHYLLRMEKGRGEFAEIERGNLARSEVVRDLYGSTLNFEK